MIRVGAIDCDSFPKVCAKAGAEKFPLWRVYPQFPAPVQDYQGSDLDVDKLKKMAYRFIGNRALEITSANHQTFVDDQPNRPKVLLFTNKKGTPIIFKALSSHFDVSLLSLLIKSILENLALRYREGDRVQCCWEIQG